MTKKQFYFIAGLQRSGGTLISSILNQNSNVWATPSSPLRGMMEQITGVFASQLNKDFDRSLDVVNTLKYIPQNFYESRDEIYILDKDHFWSKPEALNIIHKYIQEDISKIKIICPVRNILEVLASFNTIIEKTPESIGNNNIDTWMANYTAPDLPIADRRAEFLMMPNQDIQMILFGMRQAANPNLRNLFHFVEYNDLVSNPEEVVNGIYNFLEIDKFKHNFTNLESQEKPDSSTGIYNLHTVRPSIEKKSVNPSDIFSPEIIQRYSNMEFWRNLK